jgi:hypothetical protein
MNPGTGKAKQPTVAVLGAGIMGCSTALYLARENFQIKLFDMAPDPFTGASRWNEGKIHLGYLYGADPSLNTARKLIPGGVIFPSLTSDLVGCDLGSIVTPFNDRYLIHRNSVVPPEQAYSVACKVAELTLEHPDKDNYFVPMDTPRLLTTAELAHEYNTKEIVAAYEVPERSVSTRTLADYYVDAIAGCAAIEPLMGERVNAVRKSARDAWFVETSNFCGDKKSFGPFAAVVNALWEGRGAIDATVGIAGPPTWTHRYRLSLFAKTLAPTKVKSGVVAVGPFGDIKNYDGRNLYISWYLSGLLAEGRELLPPPVTKLEKHEEDRIVSAKLKNLGALIPEVAALADKFESHQLQGGWVYAAGQGSLSDPMSELHRRDRLGLSSIKNYFSIDTGKYSVAPWIAQKVARAVVESVRI